MLDFIILEESKNFEINIPGIKLLNRKYCKNSSTHLQNKRSYVYKVF